MPKYRKIWISSDHHFGHTNTWEKFKLDDGSPMRPFKSNDEMNQTMIDNHNSVVSDEDLCLFLGDVCFNGGVYDEIMPQLKGAKYLIRGNHDRLLEGRYREHFQRVLGIYIRDRFAFTHVPIHTQSLARWTANIHGHLHANTVTKQVYTKKWFGKAIQVPDPRYINCSVEQINYTPVLFDDIKARFND